MSENNQHINYSSADIEKYWRGQLSAAEQHAMEKAALEDPFLADAMEGYETKAMQATPVMAADNNELQKRLAERIEEKKENKVIPFAWWKVAAVLALLTSAGWLYTSLKNKEANSVATNEKVKATEQETPVPLTGDAEKTSTNRSDSTAKDPVIAKNNPPAAGKTHVPVVHDKDNAIAAPPAASNNQPASESRTEDDRTAAAKKDVAANTESKKEAAKAVTAAPAQKAQGFYTDNNKTAERALAGRANNFSNSFSGNILDQSNRPVANAAVQIPHLNIATQTDKWGNFSFRAEDTVLNVSIASEGYETQHILLHDSATLNQIILKPAPNNAADVVVQTNGAEIRKKAVAHEISIKILDAEPVKGWTKYNEYLEKNKKVPPNARNIHGNVVLSFEVSGKGLYDIQIEQSLDDDLDNEAIRLVRDGPNWKLLKGKKAQVTVTVKF